jgi:glutathione S-transferase
MATKMIVHGVPGSPYVRAALLTLEEKGAEYELAAMALGTLKQEPHLSRHPFGRIPAFEHDGWMLYETQAIMRYVDAVVPGPRLQPEEPRAAARMNQLMGIADWYLMPQVSRTITFNRVVAPRFNRPVDEDAVVKATPDARNCVAEIDRLLDGHTWMAGEVLSLADLLLAPHLSMFAEAREGVQVLQEHENLRGWLARIEARPSMQATSWDRLLQRVAAAA